MAKEEPVRVLGTTSIIVAAAAPVRVLGTLIHGSPPNSTLLYKNRPHVGQYADFARRERQLRARRQAPRLCAVRYLYRYKLCWLDVRRRLVRRLQLVLLLRQQKTFL